MLLVNYEEKENVYFDSPFRMMLSGSSQSGKTYFAEKLFKHNLFKQNIRSVSYRHPDYLETVPVNWHKTLSIPVHYQSGLPTLDELTNLEPYTCIVLDDLYEECVGSKTIDYLFRVLSGKKNLSIIIMSQRYFAKGRFAMNIRNNCNYTVLFRNTDARVNPRIAKSFNVDKQVSRALKTKLEYPYVFLDTTPIAMRSGFKVYEDIFSKYQIVYSDDGMKGYVIPEKEFFEYFRKVNERLASLKNEDKTTKRKRKLSRPKFKRFRREISSNEQSSTGKSDSSSEQSKSSEFSESD